MSSLAQNSLVVSQTTRWIWFLLHSSVTSPVLLPLHSVFSNHSDLKCLSSGFLLTLLYLSSEMPSPTALFKVSSPPSHSHLIFFRSFSTLLNFLLYFHVYWFLQGNVKQSVSPEQNISTPRTQYLWIEYINEYSSFCYIYFANAVKKQNSTQ